MVASKWAILLVLATSLQAPPRWEATAQRAAQLVSEGRIADAVSVLEGVLKSSPNFDPARYELADAQRLLALEAALKGPAQQAIALREFERAAGNYRRVAEGSSEYKQLAIMKLISVYAPDELDRPADLVTFARQYVLISPESAVAHIKLATALLATGREAAATRVFITARTAIRTEDRKLLATSIVEYVLKATTSPVTDLKTLTDWADGVIEGLLRESPKDRDLLLTRSASASFRADRLETDPSRKKARKAEADRWFERFREANPSRDALPNLPSPAEFPELPPPPPPPPPMPSEFQQAVAEGLSLMRRKDYVAAAGLFEKLIKSRPEFAATHYLRVNALLMAEQRQAIEPALKAARSSIDAGSESRLLAATQLFDMVSNHPTIAPADAKRLLNEARLMTDDALTKNPKYWEAAIYKSLIIRAQAKFETDTAVIKKLIAEADRVRAQAETMRGK